MNKILVTSLVLICLTFTSKESYANQCTYNQSNPVTTYDVFATPAWCTSSNNWLPNIWQSLGFRSNTWGNGLGYDMVCSANTVLNRTLNSLYGLIYSLHDPLSNEYGSVMLRNLGNIVLTEVRKVKGTCNGCTDIFTGEQRPACAPVGWPNRVSWSKKTATVRSSVGNRSGTWAHEGRHNQGYPHTSTSGRRDATYYEYGAMAITLLWNAYFAHFGKHNLSLDPQCQSNYYTQLILKAESTVTAGFDEVPPIVIRPKSCPLVVVGRWDP